jgi:hypothetical protein
MDWEPISPELEDLVLHKGHLHHLTRDEIVLTQSLAKFLLRQAERVPQSSFFLFDDYAADGVVVLPTLAGLSREEMEVAVYLRPVHTAMCATALLVLWKADQLIRNLYDAMNQQHFLVAAALARGLVEHSAAFGVETHQLGEMWRKRKAGPAADAESLRDFVSESTPLLASTTFGTR